MNVADSNKCIGYLKYSGDNLDAGIFDLRKSVEALQGFDEVLRYFLVKEEPALATTTFDVPVRIQKGSWIVEIPQLAEIPNILQASATIVGGGVVATTYLKGVAKKAASDGLFETGPAKDMKVLVSSAMKCIYWVIKIAKHLGSFNKKDIKTSIDNSDPSKIYVEITNSNGEKLRIKKKYFDFFVRCPEKLFAKNASLINSQRTLEVGVCEANSVKSVSISNEHKYVFYEDTDEVLLFPQLKHGQYVELEGGITRANERTNTLGFEYKKHIITCRPSIAHGNIVDFKEKIISTSSDHLYLPVRIVGYVDREGPNGEIKERPQIVFSDIIPLEQSSNNLSLLDL